MEANLVVRDKTIACGSGDLQDRSSASSLEDPIVWAHDMAAYKLHSEELAEEIVLRARRCDHLALCLFQFLSSRTYNFSGDFRKAFKSEYPRGGNRNKIEFARSWLYTFFEDQEWFHYLPRICIHILLQEGVIAWGMQSKSFEEIACRATEMLSEEELDVVWWAVIKSQGDADTGQFIDVLRSCGLDNPSELVTDLPNNYSGR